MIYPHSLGLFVLITLMLAGVAIGRFIGLGPGESIYFTALSIASMGWLVGKGTHRQDQKP